MNLAEMKMITDSITYKPNWAIKFVKAERPYIQISVTDSVCSISGKSVDWKSGKAYLSEFMCRQEVVGTVFGLIERAEIHEMREFFRYKGASIYNPHLDPDALVEVARKKESFNCRVDAMEMGEKK